MDRLHSRCKAQHAMLSFECEGRVVVNWDEQRDSQFLSMLDSVQEDVDL